MKPNTRVVVDPAEGWKWGFPKIWDSSKETLDAFLDKSNYPQEMRKYPMRYWTAQEEKDNP